MRNKSLHGSFVLSVIAPAEAKTRGGTLVFPGCIHTRNFTKVRKVFVVSVSICSVQSVSNLMKLGMHSGLG